MRAGVPQSWETKCVATFSPQREKVKKKSQIYYLRSSRGHLNNNNRDEYGVPTKKKKRERDEKGSNFLFYFLGKKGSKFENSFNH